MALDRIPTTEMEFLRFHRLLLATGELLREKDRPVVFHSTVAGTGENERNLYGYYLFNLHNFTINSRGLGEGTAKRYDARAGWLWPGIS